MSSTESAVASDDHPDYVFDDADLILLSSDGTKFHVHALVLKLSSSVFRDMITIGRPDENDPVSLAEDKATLAILLDMLYPGRNPPFTISHSELRAVAVAAEKYDIASVTGVLKDVLLKSVLAVNKVSSTTSLSEDDDVKGYAAVKSYLTASYLGWTSVAAEFSSKTLACNLNSQAAQGLLFAEDACGRASRELLALHRERKVWIYNMHLLLVENGSSMIGSPAQQASSSSFFQTVIPNPHRLPLAHKAGCASPITTWYNSTRWWEFKNKVLNSLEADSSGEQFLQKEFYNCIEVKNLDVTPCCQNSIPYLHISLKYHFRFNIDNVPRTIEGFRKCGRDPLAD